MTAWLAVTTVVESDILARADSVEEYEREERKEDNRQEAGGDQRGVDRWPEKDGAARRSDLQPLGN
jgi:hypothetical protein